MEWNPTLESLRVVGQQIALSEQAHATYMYSLLKFVNWKRFKTSSSRTGTIIKTSLVGLEISENLQNFTGQLDNYAPCARTTLQGARSF
eukprot:156806-Pelagomonas_calceolata.AAC.4